MSVDIEAEHSRDGKRERRTDMLIERIRAFQDFLKSIGGVPAFVMLIFAIAFGAAWFGYTKPPAWIGDNPANVGHAMILEELKTAMDASNKVHDKQTIVLEEALKVLRNMRCDAKQGDSKRLQCYRRVARGLPVDEAEQ